MQIKFLKGVKPKKERKLRRGENGVFKAKMCKNKALFNND
jgi:hypothetical protein